jgi:hypothetical protein
VTNEEEFMDIGTKNDDDEISFVPLHIMKMDLFQDVNATLK